MSLPLALTLGEPAGIGPDITLAVWQRRDELALPPFYLLADPDFLARRAQQLGLDVPLCVVEPDAAAKTFATALPVVALAERVTAGLVAAERDDRPVDQPVAGAVDVRGGDDDGLAVTAVPSHRP